MTFNFPVTLTDPAVKAQFNVCQKDLGFH